MIKSDEFISEFWKKFKWYRRKKGGTWYLIKIPKGSSTDGFQYWSRKTADLGWGESNIEEEIYESYLQKTPI